MVSEGEFLLIETDATKAPILKWEKLASKSTHLMIAASGVPEIGTVYLGAYLRIDQSSGHVDEEPLAVAIVGPDQSASGVIIHHADYPGRSAKISDQRAREAWDTATTLNYGSLPRDNQGNPVTSGRLDDLPNSTKAKQKFHAAGNAFFKELHKNPKNPSTRDP